MNHQTYTLEKVISHTVHIYDFGPTTCIQTNKDEPWALKTVDFDAIMKQEENYWWTLNSKELVKDFICAVHKKYLDWYQNGMQGKEPEEKYINVLRALKQKQNDRLVLDKINIDGYLYDMDGKPLFRHYYIEVDCTEGEAEFLISAVKKHKKAKPAMHVTRPWYVCADRLREYTVFFIYEPEQEEFEKLYTIDTDSDDYINYAILEIVGFYNA